MIDYGDEFNGFLVDGIDMNRDREIDEHLTLSCINRAACDVGAFDAFCVNTKASGTFFCKQFGCGGDFGYYAQCDSLEIGRAHV